MAHRNAPHVLKYALKTCHVAHRGHPHGKVNRSPVKPGMTRTGDDKGSMRCGRLSRAQGPYRPSFPEGRNERIRMKSPRRGCRDCIPCSSWLDIFSCFYFCFPIAKVAPACAYLRHKRKNFLIILNFFKTFS